MHCPLRSGQGVPRSPAPPLSPAQTALIPVSQSLSRATPTRCCHMQSSDPGVGHRACGRGRPQQDKTPGGLQLWKASPVPNRPGLPPLRPGQPACARALRLDHAWVSTPPGFSAGASDTPAWPAPVPLARPGIGPQTHRHTILATSASALFSNF